MIESNREEYIIKLENKIKELDSSLKKKNQDFTNAQKEINVFLSNLTHNLKNPLGTIYSFSEMILEGQKNFQFGKTEILIYNQYQIYHTEAGLHGLIYITLNLSLLLVTFLRAGLFKTDNII